MRAPTSTFTSTIDPIHPNSVTSLSYTTPTMPANVALLGSGLFAANAYLPALVDSSNTPNLNLHTLWSRSEKSVSSLSSKASDLKISPAPKTLFGDDGLEQVLADKEIDCVMIVLPISAQPDFVRKALKAGKHVMSEKPVGKDVETALKLIDEYERDYKPKGLIWRVAESESEAVEFTFELIV
jgi:predicted dehydrogenase